MTYVCFSLEAPGTVQHAVSTDSVGKIFDISLKILTSSGPEVHRDNDSVLPDFIVRFSSCSPSFNAPVPCCTLTATGVSVGILLDVFDIQGLGLNFALYDGSLSTYSIIDLRDEVVLSDFIHLIQFEHVQYRVRIDLLVHEISQVVDSADLLFQFPLRSCQEFFFSMKDFVMCSEFLISHC